MFYVNANRAYITGKHGIYDNSPAAPSVKYGRNAMRNYIQYLESTETDDKLPLDYRIRYSPRGSKTVDKMALMGQAYEALGRLSISIRNMTKMLQQNGTMPDMSAEALDLNEDNRIDIAEYAAKILFTDALSTKKGAGTSGIITNEGVEKAEKYDKKCNYAIANQIYGDIYERYGLQRAMEKFKSNVNNL